MPELARSASPRPTVTRSGCTSPSDATPRARSTHSGPGGRSRAGSSAWRCRASSTPTTTCSTTQSRARSPSRSAMRVSVARSSATRTGTSPTRRRARRRRPTGGRWRSASSTPAVACRRGKVDDGLAHRRSDRAVRSAPRPPRRGRQLPALVEGPRGRARRRVRHRSRRCPTVPMRPPCTAMCSNDRRCTGPTRSSVGSSSTSISAETP